MKILWPTMSAAVLWLGFCGIAAATSSANSVLVYDSVGSPRCESVAKGARELKVTDSKALSPGTTMTLYGDDGQAVTYTISDDGDAVSAWTLPLDHAKNAQPINFTILKSAEVSRVFFFDRFGATSDTGEQASGTLHQLSFCYQAAKPISPIPIASCDPNLCSGLRYDDERLIITLDPNASQWNVQSCTCGTQFTQCDPSAAAGSKDACTNIDGYLKYVPVEIQAAQDPGSYVCFTIAGKRKCYKR